MEETHVALAFNLQPRMDELRGQLVLVKEALSADPGNVELQALLAELNEVGWRICGTSNLCLVSRRLSG